MVSEPLPGSLDYLHSFPGAAFRALTPILLDDLLLHPRALASLQARVDKNHNFF